MTRYKVAWELILPKQAKQHSGESNLQNNFVSNAMTRQLNACTAWELAGSRIPSHHSVVNTASRMTGHRALSIFLSLRQGRKAASCSDGFSARHKKNEYAHLMKQCWSWPNGCKSHDFMDDYDVWFELRITSHGAVLRGALWTSA